MIDPDTSTVHRFEVVGDPIACALVFCFVFLLVPTLLFLLLFFAGPNWNGDEIDEIEKKQQRKIGKDARLLFRCSEPWNLVAETDRRKSLAFQADRFLFVFFVFLRCFSFRVLNQP